MQLCAASTPSLAWGPDLREPPGKAQLAYWRTLAPSFFTSALAMRS
jgi:hypothetical protein